jgi:hypothetical protein
MGEQALLPGQASDRIQTTYTAKQPDLRAYDTQRCSNTTSLGTHRANANANANVTA